jgi:hypothetical protein
VGLKDEMDELTALIEKLKGEVAALEAALDGREAEEARRLGTQEARLTVAEQRLVRARSQLSVDGAALTGLERRRTELKHRIEGWRGQLWRVGHGGMATGLVAAAVLPLPVVGIWLGTAWTLGLAATQLGLFVAAFFLIPEKR